MSDDMLEENPAAVKEYESCLSELARLHSEGTTLEGKVFSLEGCPPGVIGQWADVLSDIQEYSVTLAELWQGLPRDIREKEAAKTKA